MENLYVTFEVTVNESPYKYDPRGKSECTIQLPRYILGQIKFDGLLADMLDIALKAFDAKDEEEESDREGRL